MMRLADQIPEYERNVDAKWTTFVLTFTGAAFAGIIALLYTLERLGLPGEYSVRLLAGWTALALFFVSWFGRSVNSRRFFFAERQSEALPAGLGGASCWLSGAVIIAFFALPQNVQFILVVAIMLGLAIQAFLFAAPANASRTYSLPGLVLWRHKVSHTGLICLAVCMIVLCPMAFAEYGVATDLFAVLSGLSPANAALAVCVLALLPVLFGGWQAFLLVNVCAGLWIVLSMLAPALITGFLPFLLVNSGELSTPVLAPLAIEGQPSLVPVTNSFDATITLLVFAAGFAAMPRTLARLSITPSRITTVEGLGWSGLVVFLSLSALILSVGLIIGPAWESGPGRLLRSSPALATLPYAAVFLSAFNALAITVFVAAKTMVRTVTYYRKREPDVGSMFAVRVLAVLLTVMMWLSNQSVEFSTAELLLMALAFAAAGLFPALVFSLWVPKLPAWAMSFAMFAGTGCTLAGVFTQTFDTATSGAVGMAASSIVLVAGRLLYRPKVEPGPEMVDPAIA